MCVSVLMRKSAARPEVSSRNSLRSRRIKGRGQGRRKRIRAKKPEGQGEGEGEKITSLPSSAPRFFSFSPPLPPPLYTAATQAITQRLEWVEAFP